jgi:hypothetical protein
MMSLDDFKNAVITKPNSSIFTGGADNLQTFTHYEVTWRGNYGTYTAEDRRYDPGTPGMHELCDIIVD